MATFFYKGLEEILDGNISFTTDTIKAMFVDPSYTLDTQNDQYLSDVSAKRASGSTDQTLTSKTVARDVANSRVKMDANDLSIANETISGGTNAIIVYKDTGTEATSILLWYIDFAEGTLTPVNGTLSVTFDTAGIAHITIA